MNQSTTVSLACALGGGIGSLVALEINSYLWWVGLIIGGLVGYLAYEWQTVLRAIPKAYRAARSVKVTEGYWKEQGWFALFILCFLVDVSAILLLPWADSVSRARSMAMSSPLLLGVLCVLVLPFGCMRTKASLKDRAELIRDSKKFVYFMAPPVILFWHLPRGLWWVVRRTPGAVIVICRVVAHGIVGFIPFLIRFSWHLFRLIHSEVRLLCGVDAAIGAAIGFFAGSVLVGALGGGIFGVLNFEIVSKRILKLVPR